MSRVNNSPIGIFDSGIGGLTVFREIEKLLLNENIVYFGDTARVPYGSKSKKTIIRFSTESILFLLRKRVKLVVVACNTSSSLALDYLKKIFSVPILGVIEAGVERALKVTPQGRAGKKAGRRRIGIIGTKSTIESGSYHTQLSIRDKNAVVYSKPCPLFVPLVEEGLTSGEVVDSIVEMYLKDLRNRIDTLILGCTHYPLLKKPIAGYLKGVRLVDSAREVAFKTRRVLEKRNLTNDNSPSSTKEFYVTDGPKEFMKLARIFLKYEVNKPRVVNV